MKRFIFFHIIILPLFISVVLPVMQTQAQIVSESEEAEGLKLVVTSLDINDTYLKLVYEIRNDSKYDVWLLVDTDFLHSSMGTEIFMAEDDKTLTVRRRLDLRIKATDVNILGKYVCLRSGQSQTEMILARIPVYPSPYKFERPKERGVEYATRLAIELGYYIESSPEKIFALCKQTKKIKLRDTLYYGLKGTIYSGLNMFLTSRDEELLLPYWFRRHRADGEKILKVVIDNLHIPYMTDSQTRDGSREIVRRYKDDNLDFLHREEIGLPPGDRLPFLSPYRYGEPPELIPFTKVEFNYQPSVIEFFFPYQSQQNLLSPDEKEHLLSEKKFVIEDKKKLEEFKDILIDDLLESSKDTGVAHYRNCLDVICYYDGKPPISFSVYDNKVIGTENYLLRFRFNFELGRFGGFQVWKMFTPRMQAIVLRMRCAAKLKNQWYRLLYYNEYKAIRLGIPMEDGIIYPAPDKWCGDRVDDVQHPSRDYKEWMKPYVCPSAGEGKCHYAMNPNCKPDSPDDMVLLFETKAGWNQHGGPELFTFDNHDPKGGCVLLNDGTVKFIRTKEELNQLRWK